MILRESNNPVMSEQNLFTDFNENFGFDNSLSQTGINGYLQNEKAIEYFKNKLTEWNKVSMTGAVAGAVGLMGMPIVALAGAAGDYAANELSMPIDRIVSIMEMLLEEFKEEGITITPQVKTEKGTIDLLIRTADGRYFAFMLRSNGESKIKWREDRQGLFAIKKGGSREWSDGNSLGKKMDSSILYLKEQKNPLFGTSNTERKKTIVKGIILTAKTRIDPKNDPALLVDFGRTKALRVKTEAILYLVDKANVADFLRKPIGK
jgi:hypothetical protein